MVACNYVRYKFGPACNRMRIGSTLRAPGLFLEVKNMSSRIQCTYMDKFKIRLKRRTSYQWTLWSCNQLKISTLLELASRHHPMESMFSIFQHRHYTDQLKPEYKSRNQAVLTDCYYDGAQMPHSKQASCFNRIGIIQFYIRLWKHHREPDCNDLQSENGRPIVIQNSYQNIHALL